MSDFVVDNSVVLSWVLKDENSKKSQKILNNLTSSRGYVPSLWPYELANALFVAQKRDRIKEVDSAAFIKHLKKLPIFIEESEYDTITKDVLSLSREHNITVYDASYMELAIRKNIAMASFDKLIIRLCQKIGIDAY